MYTCARTETDDTHCRERTETTAVVLIVSLAVVPALAFTLTWVGRDSVYDHS